MGRFVNTTRKKQLNLGNMQVLAGLLNLRKMLLERTKFAITAAINWKNASFKPKRPFLGVRRGIEDLGSES